MGLMDLYSKRERVATVAFLKMVANSDHILKNEELDVINLLAKNIYVEEHDIKDLGESKLKFTLKNMTRAKVHELIRMAYTILDIDDNIHIEEMKLLEYLANIHHIRLDNDQELNVLLFASEALTPLDKVIMLSLVYQMMFVDSRVHKNELKLLESICNDMNISKDDLKGLVVPIDSLVKAIKTMSLPSVTRILKELIKVALSDGEFSKEEFEIVFPIFSELNLDIDKLIHSVEKDLEV